MYQFFLKSINLKVPHFTAPLTWRPIGCQQNFQNIWSHVLCLKWILGRQFYWGFFAISDDSDLNTNSSFSEHGINLWRVEGASIKDIGDYKAIPISRNEISISEFLFLYLDKLCYFFNQGQFWHAGIVVACVCVYVFPCLCQPRAYMRENSSLIPIRIPKFGRKMQNTLVKTPVVGGWLTLTFKVNFNSKIQISHYGRFSLKSEYISPKQNAQ